MEAASGDLVTHTGCCGLPPSPNTSGTHIQASLPVLNLPYNSTQELEKQKHNPFFCTTFTTVTKGESKRRENWEWSIGNVASLGLFNNAIFLLYVICLPIHWVDRSAGRARVWRNMRGDHRSQSIHANSGTQTPGPRR